MRDVCVVTAHFPPVANAASIRVASFVRALARRRGVRVTVYTATPSPVWPADRGRVGLVTTRAAAAGSGRPVIIRLFSEALSAAELAFRLLLARCDVFLVSSPPFMFAVLTVAVARLRGRPYVLDVRDLYPEVLFASGLLRRRGAAGMLLSALESAAYRRAGRIVTVTQGLRKHIEERGGRDVALVTNGVDPDVFRGGRSRRTAGRFTVVFHGNLGRLQDMDLVLRYARLLAERGEAAVEIVVAGDGQKEGVLRAAASDPVLGRVLRFLGRLSTEEIASLLSRAHVGLSPRTPGKLGETAFPVKVYEYLACGLPVVVSPHGEAGELLERSGAGFQVTGQSVEELDAVIERLRGDSELYARYARNALETGRRYDRTVLASELADIVLEAADVASIRGVRRS